MLKYNKLQKNYTMNSEGYQLKLPLNIDCIIPEDDSVRLLSQFVEAMDLTGLYSTYERIRGNQATPRQLLKIMLYAYMNSIYSSRKIETSCKRDINFIYLLEGLDSEYIVWRTVENKPTEKVNMKRMPKKTIMKANTFQNEKT